MRGQAEAWHSEKITLQFSFSGVNKQALCSAPRGVAPAAPSATKILRSILNVKL
jgi:hypothetical protein